MLTILKLADNAYGTSIRTQILEDTDDEWSFASIYQPLDRLVRKGFAVKIKGEPTAQRGGKSKYYYLLTPKGKEALHAIRYAQDKVWSDLPRGALQLG